MTTPWPSGVIDPHIHLWDPLNTRRHTTTLARVFRPLRRIPRGMRWVAPQADREFIGHPHHALKPYLPVDHRVDAGEVLVATVVHIEAAEVTDHVAPLIRHLHDTFGTDRTMWASNFPIDKPELTLPATLRIVTDVLGADADLTKLVRDVARRVYRIRDEGDPT